ncbi:hypothetical protein [Bartonella sp. CB178]|uniref:hypothetical protein n=1 Tax=Bartonella sp. CB178 TaxID=3112255 RepID=UPI00300E29EB
MKTRLYRFSFEPMLVFVVGNLLAKIAMVDEVALLIERVNVRWWTSGLEKAEGSCKWGEVEFIG